MSDYSWASNPWVWAVSFRRVDEPPSGKQIRLNAEAVRAILEDRKTQHRPVISERDRIGYPASEITFACDEYFTTVGAGSFNLKCPYGKPGDRLWVREAWGVRDGHIVYRADPDRHPADTLDRLVQKWSPSIHMHKTSSRITLEITEIRVQRVQEISEEDAIAEGVNAGFCSQGLSWCGGAALTDERNPAFRADKAVTGARGMFGMLWDKINAKRGPKRGKVAA